MQPARSSSGRRAGEDIQSGQGGDFSGDVGGEEAPEGLSFPHRERCERCFSGPRRFVPSEDLAGAAKKEQKKNASVEKRGAASSPFRCVRPKSALPTRPDRIPSGRRESLSPAPQGARAKVGILFEVKGTVSGEARPRRSAEKESYFGNVQQVCSERLKEKHAAEAAAAAMSARRLKGSHRRRRGRRVSLFHSRRKREFSMTMVTGSKDRTKAVLRASRCMSAVGGIFLRREFSFRQGPGEMPPPLCQRVLCLLGGGQATRFFRDAELEKGNTWKPPCEKWGCLSGADPVSGAPSVWSREWRRSACRRSGECSLRPPRKEPARRR